VRRLTAALVLTFAANAHADATISYAAALEAAHRVAPNLQTARSVQRASEPAIRAAGLYPNPAGIVGTSSGGALLSVGVSVPLVVFGQVGAGVRAARAEADTIAIETEVAGADVRLDTARAFISLWLAEGLAGTRRDAATVAGGLEKAVVARVEVGAAAELDALRIHAERLRSEADAATADAQAGAAGAFLARFIGVADATIHTSGDPLSPDAPPPLDALLARLDGTPTVRRDESDARAAEARAQRERTLARPSMALELGIDGWIGAAYPPMPGSPTTSVRAQLVFDLPIFNWRVAHVDREIALADVAHTRARAARTERAAELTAAYRTFEAAISRVKTLSEAVVPAAEAAEKAAEGAYGLGRSSLVAVLDAQRALIDSRASLLEARAVKAEAWATIEHALGTQ
jgi:cobalt-zinc-cadmium efflux system outer membrane protein